MGFHAADAGQVQADQELRHPHRGQPRAGTHQRLYRRRLAAIVGRLHRRVRQHRAARQERQDLFPEDQPQRKQGLGVAARGIQKRHSTPSRRVLPHRRKRPHQQRPRHPPAGAACRRAGCPETGLDDRRRGARDEHRAGEPGLHGSPAIHGQLVVGRIRGTAPKQRLRDMEAGGRQEYIARLRAEERQRQIQGFRTRQGAQPHGEQARKHVEEAARGSQDKDRFDTARRKEADTGHKERHRFRNIPVTAPALFRTPSTRTATAAGTSFPKRSWRYSTTSSTTARWRTTRS